MEEIKIVDEDKLAFRGCIEIYESEEDYELGNYVRKFPNLLVDDGKELILDYLLGLKSWWNPKEQSDYAGGDSGWNTTRKIGFGTCMFNNSSFARASGMEGIGSGQECQFPVEDTWLVSPEDSFLSKEVGTRRIPEITRRDQTGELKALIEVPADMPVGTKLREFGIFLQSTGPAHDPSNNDGDKPKSMICRATLYGTGYYTNTGGSCVSCNAGDPGATLCYYDDYYEVTKDVRLRWKVGEV